MLISHLRTLTLQELCDLPGMEYKRADLILGGGVLLEELMNLLGSDRVYTTSYSLRDGILLQQLDLIFHD